MLDQALFAGSNFLLNVLLARWLAPEAYGVFTLVGFAGLMLVGVAHTGLLTEPMLVFGPGAFRVRQGPYVRYVLGGHGRFVLVAAALLTGFGVALGALGAFALAYAVLALAAAQGAVLLMWLLRRACYVHLDPAAAVAGGVVYAGAMVLGLALLRAYGWATAPLAILWMGAASLGAAAVIARRLRVFQASPPSPELREEARLAHRGYRGWATATGGLEWVQGVLPFLVLPLWHGLEAAGAFRAMYNLVMPAVHVYGALGLLLVPAFVRAREGGRLRRTAAAALSVVFAGTLAYAAALGTGGERLLAWLYAGRYAEHAGLLGLLALYPLVGGAATVLGAVRRAQERPQRTFQARAGAAALMGTVGVGLIRALGLAGAIASDLLVAGAEVVLLARPAGEGRRRMSDSVHPRRLPIPDPQ